MVVLAHISATKETDADVGDRSNDALRINGADVHARVISRRGNLGVSSLAGLNMSFRGAATDFIDNSSGVNCSDHEVNIKIC